MLRNATENRGTMAPVYRLWDTIDRRPFESNESRGREAKKRAREAADQAARDATAAKRAYWRSLARKVG